MLRASTNGEGKNTKLLCEQRPALLGFLKYKLLLQGQGDCASLLLSMLKDGRQRHKDGQTYYISRGGCGTSVIPCIPAIRAEDHRFDATKKSKAQENAVQPFLLLRQAPGRPSHYIHPRVCGWLSQSWWLAWLILSIRSLRSPALDGTTSCLAKRQLKSHDEQQHARLDFGGGRVG